MIFFKAGIQAQRCFAQFASVLCLASVTLCSITTDLTVWTTARDWFRESPLLEAQREFRILSTMANFSYLVVG